MFERTSLITPEAGFVSRFGEESPEINTLGSLTRPPSKTLDEFSGPDSDIDPNELIEHRFLYRGGICLLLGPTGIGKSSLIMQLAIYLAAGKSLFGITPGRAYQTKGMRILMVQADNDDGDLTEMRDGVLAGCGLTEKEVDQALDQITVSTINDKTSDKFAVTLDGLLEESGPIDLVMIDPALAYLGGDASSQKDVNYFMHALLTPLLQKHNVGLLLVHHTNKPHFRKRKAGRSAGDYADFGAGEVEWINSARSALALLSTGSDFVFELRAIKRGKRLGWKDENGSRTDVRHISHSRELGTICWHQAEVSEIK